MQTKIFYFKYSHAVNFKKTEKCHTFVFVDCQEFLDATEKYDAGEADFYSCKEIAAKKFSKRYPEVNMNKVEIVEFDGDIIDFHDITNPFIAD